MPTTAAMAQTFWYLLLASMPPWVTLTSLKSISTGGASTIDFDVFDSAVSTVDVNGANTVNLNDLDVDNLLVTAVNGSTLDFDGTAGAGANNVRITQEGAGVTIDGAASIGAATVTQTNAGTNTITVLGGITELDIDGSRTAVVAGTVQCVDNGGCIWRQMT